MAGNISLFYIFAGSGIKGGLFLKADKVSDGLIHNGEGKTVIIVLYTVQRDDRRTCFLLIQKVLRNIILDMDILIAADLK